MLRLIIILTMNPSDHASDANEKSQAVSSRTSIRISKKRSEVLFVTRYLNCIILPLLMDSVKIYAQTLYAILILSGHSQRQKDFSQYDIY